MLRSGARDRDSARTDRGFEASQEWVRSLKEGEQEGLEVISVAFVSDW
jgi:hypothetical protein